MSAAVRARIWIRRAALALLALMLALQLWFFACIVFWRWHNPGQTAFMQRELERLERPAPGTAARAPRSLQKVWVDYARISPYLKRAVVASEDARFLSHEGVDWEAMEKAYSDNLRRGRMVRGGSTISQQLAKNLFLTAHRSYLRKAQELLIALMIEAVWDKRRILEVYLNIVEWGDGVFGAEAAARHYYGVSALQLDADQAARMAAMLPSPRFFDHHRDAAYLSQRAEAIERNLPSAQIP
ncbi:MAG TPA: monofunctional biosynthetic peptidoglycan transglycosylase [Burkholderiaceae bacterium]|nr:monofunctional biosynthetic peptidoglycan transglycosylase [Burkholderiaceae bacterium]